MESLEDLLGVQMLDTRIDQIRHQKKTLPQRQEVIDQTATLGKATAATEECAARLKALRRSQKEAEDHASILEDKATEVNGVLYDGSVSSHKELESLQQEHQQLKQHQGQYEDQALEFMELAEPVEAELELLHVATQALNERIADLEAQITVALAELDVQLDEQVREREAAQSGIPADLLGLYYALASAGQELPPAAAVADVQAVLRRLWKVKWSNFAFVPFLLLTLDGWPTAARLGKVDDRCVCGEAQCPDRAHVLFDCPGAGRARSCAATEKTGQRIRPAAARSAQHCCQRVRSRCCTASQALKTCRAHRTLSEALRARDRADAKAKKTAGQSVLKVSAARQTADTRTEGRPDRAAERQTNSAANC